MTAGGPVGHVVAAEFHALDGLQGWRLLFWGPATHVPTGSTARSLELAAAIGDVAARTGVDPDLDVRRHGVTVRLNGEADLAGHVEAAREIASAAADLGLSLDPGAVQLVQVAVDVFDLAAVLPFWRAVLAYEQLGGEDLGDPHRRNAPVWFQEIAEPRTGRGRLHVDVSVPHDQAEARVAAAVAAGGQVVSGRPPMWWTLQDPEGNLVDVATWQGRD